MEERRFQININKKWFWLNLGWYPADPFNLFLIQIGECLQDFKTKKIDFVTLFSLQVTFFSFCFGWKKRQNK